MHGLENTKLTDFRVGSWLTDGYEIKPFTPVTYVTHMGDDNFVCDCARVSFDKKAENFTDEQNEKLIQYLARHNHWSPFAHPQVTFRFKCPLFIARQFQKHQIGYAWNEVSRRYVDYDPTFYVPDSWRKRPDNMKQGSTNEGEIFLEGRYLNNYMHQSREWVKDYKTMKAEGVCPEQIRMVMPQAMMTEWIWTGSLQAWSRFVNLRGDSHAQQECWIYAEEVAMTLTKLFPMSARALLGEYNA
jgi:thymidylate synthase (FAD)